jgi:hypothetical protein
MVLSWRGGWCLHCGHPTADHALLTGSTVRIGQSPASDCLCCAAEPEASRPATLAEAMRVVPVTMEDRLSA